MKNYSYDITTTFSITMKKRFIQNFHLVIVRIVRIAGARPVLLHKMNQVISLYINFTLLLLYPHGQIASQLSQ